MSNNLKICEIFRSIQGEGLTAGEPTIFIRTSGCNLNCSWCDTQYHREGKFLSIKEILKKVDNLDSRIMKYEKYRTPICITGGEPLIQENINNLVTELLNNRFSVNIETNGTFPPLYYNPTLYDLNALSNSSPLSLLNKFLVTYTIDFKLPSSGEYDAYRIPNILALYNNYKNSIKFVISTEEDYKIAKNIIINEIEECKINECTILFSPCSAGEIKPWQLAEKIIKDNLPVRLSLLKNTFLKD